MKHLSIIALILFLIGTKLSAGLTEGSIVFTAFNADGEDALAFVALNTIPPNTTIYMTDTEWDGTTFDEDESDIVWTSGDQVLPMGTVVMIYDLFEGVNTTHGSVSGSISLSAEEDAIFAYLGTGMRMPTMFLAGIANMESAYGTLENTGLEIGTSAIVLTESTDVAEYDGQRHDLQKEDYLAFLNDMENWLIQDTEEDDQNDGEAPDLPFNGESFTIFNPVVTSPTGDIAFIAFNADGDDALVFVALNPIQANTNVYFTDSEWDGLSFGTDESDVIWNSGSSTIIAGSVITIYNLNEDVSTNYGSASGSISLSDDGDAVFAYYGSDVRMPSTFLAAIANDESAFGILDNTGLQLGLTAILLPWTADIAQYIGPRDGMLRYDYLLSLNNMDNWNWQDSGDDDSEDGSEPDLPFNDEEFVIDDADITPADVTMFSVIDEFTIQVVFSENVINAETVDNYTFYPSATIENIEYDSETNTATITHGGLISGTAYDLTISSIEDAAGNVMSVDWISDVFFYNTTTPALVITEIMYNAPSDDSDLLEFIEIYNNGETPADLGGLVVKDDDSFTFEFPEYQLLPGEIVLLATDASTADVFYGVSFMDMVDGEGDMLSNTGEMIQIVNSNEAVVYSIEYSSSEPWPTEADGTGPSIEFLNTSFNAENGDNWIASSNLVGESLGEEVFASPGTFVSIDIPQVSFVEEYVKVNETDGQATLTVTLSDVPEVDVTFEVAVLEGIGYAENSADFQYMTTEYTIPAGSTDPTEINVQIIDNFIDDNDRLFALGIQNISKAVSGAEMKSVVFIVDNDNIIPAIDEDLEMEYVSSFLVDENGSAETAVYDPASERLFVQNAVSSEIAIIDFEDPANLAEISTVDMSSYGEEVTSVAVMNGTVAITVTGENYTDGKVVFMDTDGNVINQVTVGNYPEMVMFSPDGNYVLTANEGIPNSDYSIDPEGSVSVIDISGGIASLTQAEVSTVGFGDFDSQIEDLRSAGVRIFGENATVSTDMEPEYLTISDDSQTAWISCQENNALVVLDITSKMFTDILPLGSKDLSMNDNSFDQTDVTDFIFMGNWNVKGMYLPDAITSYNVNGTTYIVTANDGIQREYDQINENVTVGDEAIQLDPVAYPHSELLKKDFMLGRLVVSPYTGDTDNDGDIDELNMFGGRSFSIWNASTGELVYDSKNDFEKITSLNSTFGAIFNAGSDNNEFKYTSNNKGPEPEGVTVAQILDKNYAFVTLKQIGGIMVYDVTNPENPMFVNYFNTRTVESLGGDLGSDGVIYISPEESPTARGMVVVANEASATVSVYTIHNDMAPLEINVGTIEACVGETVELGAFDSKGRLITATGGSREYEFAWTPSHKLDDPTDPNPSYGPVLFGTTNFTLTVRDLQTEEVVIKNIQVKTLAQPNIFASSVTILRTSDFGINCYNLNNLVDGDIVSQNWYDVDMNAIEDPTCVDFSMPGIKRVYVEGVSEAGCISRMKRIIVFTANGKQSVEENDITVSEDGNALIYTTPNPVVTDVNIFADFAEAADIQVSIYDMRGGKVLGFSRYGTSIDEKVNLSELTSGVYFIRVTDGQSEVVQKIVKQ